MESPLFSHPDVPEPVSYDKRCEEPAEYPTFSDRPEPKAATAKPSS